MGRPAANNNYRCSDVVDVVAYTRNVYSIYNMSQAATPRRLRDLHPLLYTSTRRPRWSTTLTSICDLSQLYTTPCLQPCCSSCTRSLGLYRPTAYQPALQSSGITLARRQRLSVRRANSTCFDLSYNMLYHKSTKKRRSGAYSLIHFLSWLTYIGPYPNLTFTGDEVYQPMPISMKRR